MKRLLILTLILTATAAFADGPSRRTVVIKDGKVVSNTLNGVEVVDGRDLLVDGQFLFGPRAHLGVRMTELSSELREHYGASKDAGVLVSSVEKDSPADKAGVEVGDVIISVDGKEVETPGELRRALVDKRAGDSVRLELVRNRSRQTAVATLVERRGDRQLIIPRDIPGLRFDDPEWRARIESVGDCAGLQSRIKELESRLKDLEKKLQK